MDRALTIERRLAAPPATVWRCWVDPALLSRWWVPHPVTMSDTVIELRPGGRFSYRMTLPDGAVHPMDFCLLDQAPELHLTFTDLMTAGFRPAGRPMFGFTAFITLAPAGQGTLYRADVLHQTPEARNRHADMGFHDGWGTVIGQLDALSASL